jgi:hypothetical protein
MRNEEIQMRNEEWEDDSKRAERLTFLIFHLSLLICIVSHFSFLICKTPWLKFCKQVQLR